MGDMVNNLHWLGHSCFRWDGSRTIYFDPWKVSAGSKKADIIFISHEHYDHFSINDISLLAKENTIFVCPKSVAGELKNAGLRAEGVKQLLPGDNAEVAGIKIKAVASYNINKKYHTKNSGKLGFVVTMDGVTVYHAGDTDKIPEMDTIACDIAMVPVSGTYVMTAEEAAEAVNIIKPKIAIPMHYGDIVGSATDGDKFRRLLEGKIKTEVLQKES